MGTEGSAEGMVEFTTAIGEMMSPENGTNCNPLEEIANSDPCKLCQCTDGVMVCAQEDCTLPEPYNQSCKPLPIEAGKCCPKYECEIPDEIQEDDASGDVDSEASADVDSEASGDVDSDASGDVDSEASGANEDEAIGDDNTTTEKTSDTLPSNSDDAVTELNADETTTKAMEDDMKMEVTTKMIDDVPSSTEAESDAAKDTVTTESEDEVNTTTPKAMDDSEALPSVVTEKVQEKEEEDNNATEEAIMETTTKSDTSDAAVTESDATADTTVAGRDKTDDSMTKGPRMDTSSETEAETTTATIIEVPAATSEASIDSDSLVTEGAPGETTTALPVTVIGVQEDGDTVTIVTMKPTTEDDMSGDGEGSTTTMQSIIDDETATTTVAADTTTTAPTAAAAADQEFLCTHTQNDTDTSGDLPMNCTQMEGEEKKTVMLLIPKEVLGDISLTRLFDKNVKIVVKDFMVMDRSPRRL